VYLPPTLDVTARKLISVTMFTTPIRVRFSETDGQGVVFNANYAMYADAAFDEWLLFVKGREWTTTTGRALPVAATSTWRFKRSAKFLDVVDVSCEVPRFGTTSFDVRYVGTIGGEDCFDGLVTYVCVDEASRRPLAVPLDLKRALSTNAAHVGPSRL
jgi:acyl-CoA thioester hydrolase